MFSIKSAKEVANYLENQILKDKNYQTHVVEDPQQHLKAQQSNYIAQTLHDIDSCRDGHQIQNCKEVNTKELGCQLQQRKINEIQALQQLSFHQPCQLKSLDQSFQTHIPEPGPVAVSFENPQRRVQKVVQKLKDVFKKYIVETVSTSSQKIKQLYQKYNGHYRELNQSQRNVEEEKQKEQSFELDNTVYLEKQKLIIQDSIQNNDDQFVIEETD